MQYALSASETPRLHDARGYPSVDDAIGVWRRPWVPDMKTVRLCKCGCGGVLDGARQQRLRPECRIATRLAVRRKHREWARNSPKHKAKDLARAMKKYNADPEKERAVLRKRAARLHLANRMAAIDAYGGKCRCCGEGRWQFLTLSHDRGDGAAHRKLLVGKHHRTSGAKYLRKMAKLGFPQDLGISILCANCHVAEDCHGGCPHIATPGRPGEK